MTNEPQAIEVEVLEIDGAQPPAPFVPREDPAAQRQPPWQNWQGRVRQLDARWWPPWVILGAIMIFLILTVGVVIGILMVVFRIIRGIIHAIIR